MKIEWIIPCRNKSNNDQLAHLCSLNNVCLCVFGRVWGGGGRRRGGGATNFNIEYQYMQLTLKADNIFRAKYIGDISVKHSPFALVQTYKPKSIFGYETNEWHHQKKRDILSIRTVEQSSHRTLYLKSRF